MAPGSISPSSSRPPALRANPSPSARKPPPLGKNGGEPIRVGYSFQSMFSSKTTVEKNLFERCDGELEIISNKSCDNVYRNNTFLQCAGFFTLRHGNRCTVDGNYFLGKGKKGSGGVRIIGEDHAVTNN